MNLTTEFDSENFAYAMSIVDPIVYADILTMPKLIISTSGDEFLMPDNNDYVSLLRPPTQSESIASSLTRSTFSHCSGTPPAPPPSRLERHLRRASETTSTTTEHDRDTREDGQRRQRE